MSISFGYNASKDIVRWLWIRKRERKEQIEYLRETIRDVFDNITATRPSVDLDGRRLDPSPDRGRRFGYFLDQMDVILEHRIPDLTYSEKTEIKLAFGRIKSVHESYEAPDDFFNRLHYNHLYRTLDRIEWLELPAMPRWKWKQWPKDARAMARLTSVERRERREKRARAKMLVTP